MPGSPCLGCGKRARTQPAKPPLPAMRSIEAPMIAMSRAAISSMRSTADASQVGLSHSTQVRKPASMASESKGRLAGFIGFSLAFSNERLAGLYEQVFTRMIREGFVKSNLAQAAHRRNHD